MNESNNHNRSSIIKAAFLFLGCLVISVSVFYTTTSDADADEESLSQSSLRRRLQLVAQQPSFEQQQQELLPPEPEQLPPQPLQVQAQQQQLVQSQQQQQQQEGGGGGGGERNVVVIDEATQQKQMKSYLGGLYPPVDKDMLPLYLRDTADTPEASMFDLTRQDDLVFFWHIPKASGSTMKNLMNFCFGLKRAEKVKPEASMEMVRDNILNMDTSSPEGLSFSFANQIVNSGFIDVIVSNYFLSGAALFNDVHHGRTFTILRHPVFLAQSLFYYRRKASWERAYRKDWQSMTFMDYASSDMYMDNWMVRQLTGTMPWVELNESHLERAKLIMRRKIFVGILEEMGETVRQLKAHFGWEEVEPFCAHNYLMEEPANSNKHPGLQGGRGGPVWNVVAQKEKWDMSLYHFGLQLFAEQRVRYPPTPQEQQPPQELQELQVPQQ